MANSEEIETTAHRILSRLPAFWQQFWSSQMGRVCEEVSLVLKPGGTVLDLGGRPGFHAAICAALQMRAICVDNYWQLGEQSVWGDKRTEHDGAMEVAGQEGVEFIHTDILSWEPPFPEGSVDAVMSFQTMEHFHHSPRGVFQRLVRVLKLGGLFVLSVPNAAKLVNRLRVPFGHNPFSTMDRWYFREYFDYHVREPIVADLKVIAADLRLSPYRVLGRNWPLYIRLPRRAHRLVAPMDHFLRLWKTLCFDIYLIGVKPPAAGNETPCPESPASGRRPFPTERAS